MAEIHPHPLVFVVEAVTPRLTYTLDFALKEVLGFSYLLLTPDAPRPPQKLPYYNYTRQELPDCEALTCTGLLYESDIRPQERIDADDYFSYLFFHLSEYAQYLTTKTDVHDRHLVRETEPVLENLLQFLERFFSEAYDEVNPPRKKQEFDFELTIDVDHPWKFRHKGSKVVFGGGLKDLLKFRMLTLAERIRYLSRGADPYDIEAEICRICPPEKTTLFFLVDGDHANDSRYSLRMPPYQDMVRKYQQAGFTIGLHPSYTSYLDRTKIVAEKDLLESVVGPVTRSRQHYLRYRLPETFQHLTAAGIQQEYSTCPPAQSGTKTGILRPYRWFDLSKNEITELEIVPAVVMDRTLQQYQSMQPRQAAEEIIYWIRMARMYQGKFVLILHNETFSESGEWRGWKQVIEETVAYLQSDES